MPSSFDSMMLGQISMCQGETRNLMLSPFPRQNCWASFCTRPAYSSQESNNVLLAYVCTDSLVSESVQEHSRGSATLQRLDRLTACRALFSCLPAGWSWPRRRLYLLCSGSLISGCIGHSPMSTSCQLPCMLWTSPHP